MSLHRALSVFVALSLISVKEAQFNTYVKNTLQGHKHGYKISDVAGGKGQRRPFDGFGIYNNQAVFWEAKLMKGVYAFNIKDLFEGQRGHQMETFEAYSSVANPPLLWVILCCYIPRKSRVYTFPYYILRILHEQGHTSVPKKVLEALPYTGIHKQIITEFEPLKLTTIFAQQEGEPDE